MTRDEAIRVLLDLLYDHGTPATEAAEILHAVGIDADEVIADIARIRASIQDVEGTRH